LVICCVLRIELIRFRMALRVAISPYKFRVDRNPETRNLKSSI